MHQADLHHTNDTLQAKLEKIYTLRRTRSKINWDRTQFTGLLKALGNPHKALPPVVHVAGTNGKGSVIAILRSIMEAQGYRVHAYTSPHLVRVNERIVLAGMEIEDAALELLIDDVMALNNNAPLSFFEIITAVAFKAFSSTPADILLLEVGMGGRLDCTNVIDDPLVSVINRISMDHTEFLGESLVGIAKEKAGIMRRDVPCVVGSQGPADAAKEVIEALKNAAQQYGVSPSVYGEQWDVTPSQSGFSFVFGTEEQHYPLPALEGAHQVYNAGVALAALQHMKESLPLDGKAIAQGLENVRWPGRMQRINPGVFDVPEDVEIWLDCAHNDSAGEALAQHIKNKHPDGGVHLVMGMLGTKSAEGFLAPLIQLVEALHVVPIKYDPKSRTKNDIDSAVNNAVPVHDCKSSEVAVKNIISQNKNSKIYIVGSVYLAGEILSAQNAL